MSSRPTVTRELVTRAARYLVKEPGCTQEGRVLLVKFEDVEAGVAVHG